MGAPGCDDAPVIQVKRGLTDKPFTLILPYYENPRFLERQLHNWYEWPHDVRRMARVILVDDGSPRNPAKAVLEAVPLRPVPIRLFRIEVDVRWNWLAARNIGAHYANDGWCVLTDMDHVLPSSTAVSLLYGQHDERLIYRFSRVEHTGKSIHPHPNSWFMTRAMYWKIGGYDEALSGFYGTDGDYRRRCAATAKIKIMTDWLVRHEYVLDSSTTDYKRKQPEDAAKKPLLAKRKPGWRPKTLSFPYHEVPVC